MYMIIIYLLLNMGVGGTTQQQLNYQTTWQQNQTISDAPLVADNPNFPTGYNHNPPARPPRKPKRVAETFRGR